MTSIESNPSPKLQATTFSRFFHMYWTSFLPFCDRNIPMILYFSWLSSLLDRSHEQGTLHLKDLYDLTPDFESSKLTTELENKWLDEVKRNGKKASLIRATIRATRWEFFFCGLFLIPFVSRIILSRLFIMFFLLLDTWWIGSIKYCTTIVTSISDKIFSTLFNSNNIPSVDVSSGTTRDTFFIKIDFASSNALILIYSWINACDRSDFSTFIVLYYVEYECESPMLD